MFLEILQNSQENACARVSLLIKLQAWGLSFLVKLQPWGLQVYKKETVEKVFSSEFYEISKNTLFAEHLPTTASIYWFFRDQCRWSCLNTLKCFWNDNERKTKHPFLIKKWLYCLIKNSYIDDFASYMYWSSKRRMYYCELWRRLHLWGLKEDPVTEDSKENPIDEKPKKGITIITMTLTGNSINEDPKELQVPQ